ncbi:MAG: urea ABC transporter substrate-binding protein [Prochlorococcus sp. SP3034]|nr:urea ABC transporter substrate-binding protein [Prochlorococcus sp. SP3034]|tara:strand:- start:10448 stop:11692 length:1245 start_codon:yes stop_codon:yes gene_type:complete
MKTSKLILASVITSTFALIFYSLKVGIFNTKSFDDTITIGILHSLSGHMAITETPLVDSAKMAISEINASGGIKVGGKSYKVKYILEDGASDWPTFAAKAKKLIIQDKVSIIFGGWTTESRKAMIPIFDKNNAILYYPASYEGEECTNNIFYSGATPNQQILPANDFMFKRSPASGKPFFLVGADNTFTRNTNEITKAQINSLGGVIKGERYLPVNNTEVAPIVFKIKNAMPEGGVIINNLIDDQNITFFKHLKSEGITPDNKYYVMSFKITEKEVLDIGTVYLENHYVALNYMMSIDTSESKEFSKNFQKIYGKHRVVTNPLESSYNMLFLWKKAVEEAKTFNHKSVKEALIGQRHNAPQGTVEVMSNYHLAQNLRIGKVNSQGGFSIIEETGNIPPKVWSPYKTKSKDDICK